MKVARREPPRRRSPKRTPSKRDRMDRSTNRGGLDRHVHLVVGTSSRFLNLPEDSIQVERSRFLPRRKFGEVGDLVRDKPLHLIQQIGMGDDPVPISVRVFVRSLEG